MTKAALLVVDIQNDFLPGGALPVASGLDIIDGVNALMPRFDTVVLTQDWHPADHISFADNHAGASAFSAVTLPYGEQVLWPRHCEAGTPGAEFAPGLQTRWADAVVRKGVHSQCDSYSGFVEADGQTLTGLAGYLHSRQIDTVYVCGLATDFCVAWTAVDACKEGFQTYIIVDASGAIDTGGSLAAARQQWRAAGVGECSLQQVDAMICA